MIARIFRKIIDTGYGILRMNSFLGKFKPVLDAIDEFFFGTPRVTPGAPHIMDGIDLKRYMITVLIAVLPCLFAGLYFFGIRVLYLVAVSYIFGGICEVLFAVVRKKEINEGFLITGIIYALILPPTLPLWMAAVGIIVGVVFGKEAFGGTGKNIFNPALVGRIFLAVTFPVEMSASWKAPFIDAVTTATPLINFKTLSTLTPLRDLFLGTIPGSIGETCKLAIIIGGVFLCMTKVANWRIPAGAIASAAITAFIFHQIWPAKFAPPLFQLLSGGLLFGAFFMATDPVTSPFTQRGRWIYAIILGALVICIRGFSGYSEGVMFGIILMNMLSPLIDQLVLGARYKKENG